MTKTPKTDAQAYDVLYRGEFGGWFTANEIKKDSCGDHVSADFARQLEEENATFRENITPILQAFLKLIKDIPPTKETAQEVEKLIKPAVENIMPFLNK